MAKTKLKKIDEAWLGLDNLETELFNPMSMLHATDDDFNLKLAFLMTRPEYLSFICKEVLNIQLLPSQSLFSQPPASDASAAAYPDKRRRILSPPLASTYSFGTSLADHFVVELFHLRLDCTDLLLKSRDRFRISC